MEPAEALRILDEELERGRALVEAAAGEDDLARAEVTLFGRKSAWTAVQKSLGSLAPEHRKSVGMRSNEVRSILQAAIDARREAFAAATEEALVEADRVDVTLPGRQRPLGALHPMTITEQEIVDVFLRMGYRVAEGPEVETDWYNFTALNIPPDHPARSMKDSLYVEVEGHPDLLLRTETSAVQIHTMESQPPPVYVVSPGRVYRREAADATHSSVFHQIEGLAVDEGITFADLKGTLEAFARAVFGPEQRVRLVPSYFPFVEPGAQVDISCFTCGGSGCSVCTNGWIEMLGAGMVHPKVLENVGYDPERYTGFAFGMGLERVTMVRYGIPDIRLFFEGDVRFLAQFTGAA
jgi:phenylalanyl-tRNA synthetase alpha chain